MKLKYFLKGLHSLCFVSLLMLTVSCTNTKRNFYSVKEEFSESSLSEKRTPASVRQDHAQDHAIYNSEIFVAQKIDPIESRERVGMGLGKVDFLFVVDNSASMATYQDKLKEQFQSLYESFKTDELDFQLAVITTDAYRSDTPDFHAAPGNDKILTQNTVKLKRQFMENVSVGEEGGSVERGVDSAIAVLKQKRDFLRSDAHLSIIIISNEDESGERHGTKRLKEYYVPLYMSELEALKPSNDFSVSVIINNNKQQYKIAYGAYGDLYIDIASKTSGSIYNINDDFGEIMSQYGGTVLEKVKKQEPYYFLLSSKRSLSHRLKVLINGVEKTEGTHYFYSESKNGIYFSDSSLPEEGDQIEVQYHHMGH